MHYIYNTEGTCASRIAFDLEGNMVTNVQFTGGCDGSLKMLSKLVDGWSAEQIVEKCAGNTCDASETSCADQLASAILAAQKAKDGSRR